MTDRTIIFSAPMIRTLPPVTLTGEIHGIGRGLKLRARVYPRWIGIGKLKQAMALTPALAPITAAWVGLPLSFAAGAGAASFLKRPFSWL